MLLPAQNEEREGVLDPAAFVSVFRWILHTPVYPGNREMDQLLEWDGGG